MTAATAANPWDVMQRAYRTWGEPVSTALARQALNAAELAPGSAVLDVGAGSGSLAVTAALDGHRVHATDTSADMLGVLTARLAPLAGSRAEYMDALNLTFPDNTFDAAFSVLSVVFFGDRRAAAVQNMVRVTCPGGVVGLVAWTTTWGSPIFELLSEAARRTNDSSIAAFGPPVPEAAIDPSAIGAALRQGGCGQVSFATHEVTIPLPPPEQAFDELSPMYANFPQFGALTDEQRQRLRGEFTEVIREHRTEDGRGPTVGCHIVLGVVPGDA